MLMSDMLQKCLNGTKIENSYLFFFLSFAVTVSDRRDIADINRSQDTSFHVVK